MTTAHRTVSLLAAVCIGLAATTAASAGETLNLAEAVRQAIDSNLDLAARHRALAAQREDVSIARARLLPQIDVSGQAQVIETNRSSDNRGFAANRSGTIGTQLSQVIYDETDWANFRIQQHVYDEQAQSYISFRLGIAQNAASAFLELDRSRALLVIQQSNRELTRRSLETTRARVAAGYSGDRELLRWQAQIDANDQEVERAKESVLVNRFELNRVRNRPRETPAESQPATIQEYGFVYARSEIAGIISTPRGDARLRDFLVQVGVDRSPDIAAIDASIAAQERRLRASTRAFWLPSLSLVGGASYLDESDHLAVGGAFDQTEYGVGAVLEFPIFEGGAKFAELRQARENLTSLNLQREAAVLGVDSAIRSAFARASTSYRNIAFARGQEQAAQKNWELVYASYVLGVASYLDMLDAQSLLLEGRLGLVNATYTFLADLVVAEKELAYYPFLEPAEDVARILNDVERNLTDKP